MNHSIGENNTPSHTIGKRIDRPLNPDWQTLIIVFREGGCQHVNEALEIQPFGNKIFTGINPENTHQIIINNKKIGIVDHCLWGGPQAAMIVEEAIEIKFIIGVGACGSLSKSINKGDLVIIRNSLTTDGTSKIYHRGESTDSSSLLFDLAYNLKEFSPISTTAVCINALFQETKELITKYITIGGEVINMESSAFYSSSKSCGIESLWIGCVSDSLVNTVWIDWSHTENMSFKSGLFCKKIIESLHVQLLTNAYTCRYLPFRSLRSLLFGQRR